jgi:hypothetical protein
LRPDVKRFEQVRLAGAVRPDGEHEARLQRELELGVGAKVTKRNRRDDQQID